MALPLSLALLQKAQAEAEGFANGPAPALNNANIYTQDSIGNHQTPTTSPVPYYPSSETPNLQLSTEDMPAQLANNFVILDKAVTSVEVNGNAISPIANFVNTPSVTFSVIGGNISAVSVSSSVWASLTGDMTETQVIPWDGPTVGTKDTGISRVGAASIAIGNGIAGDFSGSLKLTGINNVGTYTDSTGAVGTLGQLLESTATGTAWVAPASKVQKTIRVDMGTIASATPSLVTSVSWPVAFADNNYTIVGSVVILETPPAGASTEIITVSSIELAASGTGFSFVVCNASSGAHHVIAQFIAVHD